MERRGASNLKIVGSNPTMVVQLFIKDDNKGIKLIKEFVETLYKEMTEERNKRK